MMLKQGCWRSSLDWLSLRLEEGNGCINCSGGIKGWLSLKQNHSALLHDFQMRPLSTRTRQRGKWIKHPSSAAFSCTRLTFPLSAGLPGFQGPKYPAFIATTFLPVFTRCILQNNNKRGAVNERGTTKEVQSHYKPLPDMLGVVLLINYWSKSCSALKWNQWGLDQWGFCETQMGLR